MLRVLSADLLFLRGRFRAEEAAKRKVTTPTPTAASRGGASVVLDTSHPAQAADSATQDEAALASWGTSIAAALAGRDCSDSLARRLAQAIADGQG